MDKPDKLKIYTFSKLSKQKLLEVRTFVAQCELIDREPARFYWENIADRKNRSVNEILCYSRDVLVAYLALYHFEAQELEVTLMVHPDYRTPTFYGVLWTQLKQAMSRFSIDIGRYVFTCNQQFYSLKDYMRRLGAECAEWTYQLAISPGLYAKSVHDPLIAQVRWRAASIEDIPLLTAIETENFKISETVYEAHLQKTLENSKKAIWIAEIDDQVAAKIHVERVNAKKAVLYDFCMPMIAHNQQYEVAILQSMLDRLFQESLKKIEVEVTDEYDLHWYKRLNFKCIHTYEHWRLRPYVSPLKERVKQLDTLLLNFNCCQTQDPSPFVVYKH